MSRDEDRAIKRTIEGRRDAGPLQRAAAGAMMITHHQGAIRMARAELAKGGSAQLREIARAIVSAQKREITQLNTWRKAWYGATSPSGGIPPA